MRGCLISILVLVLYGEESVYGPPCKLCMDVHSGRSRRASLRVGLVGLLACWLGSGLNQKGFAAGRYCKFVGFAYAHHS